MNLVTITKRELILLRDSMPLEELKRQTKEAREKFGYVDMRNIFKIMGYEHTYSDNWKKVK